MRDDRVILKEDRVMVVADETGDIPLGNTEGLGLYLSDTRFLSGYQLRLNNSSPVVLSTGVAEGYVATIQMVNPRLVSGDDVIPQQTVSIRRTRFVYEGLHERIGLQNCAGRTVEFELTLQFDADFKDIFDVRGVPGLSLLGSRRPLHHETSGITFSYSGLDGLHRSTAVTVDPPPDAYSESTLTYNLRLQPAETRTIVVDVIPRLGDQDGSMPHFDQAIEALGRSYARWYEECAEITTDNELLNELIRQSRNDLRVLVTTYETGPYPMAGIPWFSVPFGRDGLIVGCQTLMLNPGLARGVLRYLAAHQGQKIDRSREEEPGKILHEVRSGELALLGQIPHTPYFGSIDATPLFLVLLVELMRWQWDPDLFAGIEPGVQAALAWIDRYGDLDGDGLIEFEAHNTRGVRNQGWKDSHDSTTHADGRAASLPAALIEVQGYVVHAWAGLATVLGAMGRAGEAQALLRKAAALRRRLDKAFWISRGGFYAQALDRGKAQVTTISSNPGHCLWSEALPGKRAAIVADRLVEPDMFTGWGLRTLSSSARSYNPMSYHNGSIWPHDNSIVADGMRRYGFDDQALMLIEGCLSAGIRLGGHLPELFCGFERDQRYDSHPAEYVVSGRPQAWGAAATFHFLQTLLGVRPDARNGRFTISPLATELCREITVERMPIAGTEVSFRVTCDPDGGSRLQVLDNPDRVRIELES
jgi:glycogen debranching enzyme